jgi:hypothetical protein
MRHFYFRFLVFLLLINFPFVVLSQARLSFTFGSDMNNNVSSFFRIKDPAGFQKDPGDSSNLEKVDLVKKIDLRKGGWLTAWLTVDSSAIGQVLIYSVYSANNFARVYFEDKLVFDYAKIDAGAAADAISADAKNKIKKEDRQGQLKDFIFYKPLKTKTRVLVYYVQDRSDFFYLGLQKNEPMKFTLSLIENSRKQSILVGACVVLGLFSLLFFLIFLFNRSEKFNLWFAVFCVSIGTVIVFIIRSGEMTDAGSALTGLVAIGLMQISFFFFLNQYIFSRISKLAKIFAVTITVIFILFSLIFVFQDPVLSGVAAVGFILSPVLSLIEVIRVIISGLRKKSRQALFAAIGFGISSGIFAVVLVDLFGSGLWQDQSHSLFLLSLCAVVFPVLMGINLSTGFAKKSKQLLEQLQTINRLHEQNILNEKEKQEIVLRQKENLEVQVRERTAEVVKQKEDLEIKQKEILDSIYYARRIQRALITNEVYIDRVLKELNN